MQKLLRARLEELKRDFEVGERRLRELEMQQTQLRETMLRIDGAMQLLRELLAHNDAGCNAPSPDQGAQPMQPDVAEYHSQ